MVTVFFNSRGKSLEAKQKLKQRAGETITYILDMSPWAVVITGTPTILKAVDITIPLTDVQSTVFPSGAVSEDGNEITLKPMTALTVGIRYRVHINFTDGTDTFEATFLVECTNG